MNKKKLIILAIILGSVLVICALILVFKKEIKLELIGKANISVNINEKYKDAKVKACYGNIFSCKKIDYSTFGNVDTTKLGTYKIRYKVTHNKKSKTVSRIVKVVDKKNPTLTINTKDFTICPNGKTKNYDYKAEDNLDGDLTEKVEVKVEYDKLVFTVQDSAKNVTKKTFSYKKEDNEAPQIALNGNKTKYVLVGESYSDEGVNVTDDCDDLSGKVKTSSSVDTSKPGTYYVNYEVTDEAGNNAKETRTVIVYNKNIDVTPSEKTIYLTFDDGPGPYTAQLLDILKKYNVKATFFVTNQYPAYESLITREAEEGHSVAIHTYTHNYSYVYSSVENYFADLNNMQEKIKKLTGKETRLVRFPGGSSNTISRRYSPGIMTTLANELEARGYKYFDWNVVSGDAGETTSTSKVIANVTSNLRSSYTNVLQHDVKAFSVNAVESIIQYGLTNGYHFAPLDVTSPGAHQKINN